MIYADDATEILAIGHDRLYSEISHSLWQKLDLYSDEVIAHAKTAKQSSRANCHHPARLDQ